MSKEKMKSRLPINPLYFSFFVMLFFVACAKKAVFNEFKLIAPAGWSADSICAFEMEVNEPDLRYNLFLNVRHTGAYPYQNLWLFVEKQSPDSILFNDTIACNLADHTGKWLGAGSGSVYLLSVPYQQQFDSPGVYTYKIRHGMREDNLKGINAIGLRLAYQYGKE
ncbi:MAG: gliding motility lipoprotein GldH [Paludibacter sp.]|nr:gliding motility lipoprotein GldH [Paludibacter sp.]